MTAPHTGEAPAALVFERVPAASGSLLRAWVAVGLPRWKEERQERATAAWAGAATAGWIMASLVVATVLDVLSGLVGAVFGMRHGQLSFHPAANGSALLVALGPLYHLATVFAIDATVALCTALLHYGSFGARFVRVLRPWALVQVPISVAGLIAAWTATPWLRSTFPFPQIFSQG